MIPIKIVIVSQVLFSKFIFGIFKKALKLVGGGNITTMGARVKIPGSHGSNTTLSVVIDHL